MLRTIAAVVIGLVVGLIFNMALVKLNMFLYRWVCGCEDQRKSRHDGCDDSWSNKFNPWNHECHDDSNAYMDVY